MNEKIIIAKPFIDYKFNCPSDTEKILFDEIIKKSKFKIETQKLDKKQKLIDWWYECKNQFVKNIYLLFGKLIPENLVDKEKDENKDKYLKLVIDEFEKFKEFPLFKKENNEKKIFDLIIERNGELFKNLARCGFIIETLNATCHWRMVIGLGAAHPQETSMTLHHIYGFPYIPGSAVKGITKHWVVLKLAEKYKVDDEKLKNKDDIFETAEKIGKSLEEGKEENYEIDGIKFAELIDIFGKQKQEGKVIFMDAFPVGEIKLKIDIMNPHYPNYYSGNEPPADWQNPTPIKFLTVEETAFNFQLLSKNQKLLENAKKLLKDALENYGIGAKTALGYGLFGNFKEDQ